MATIANLPDGRGLPAAGPPTLRQRIDKVIRRTWRGIREWCGDAAYESYLRSVSRRHAGECLLTAEEFYVKQLERRYSRPNRCC